MKKADPNASVCISNDYGHLNDAVVGNHSGMYHDGTPWSNETDGHRLSDQLMAENEALVAILEKLGTKVHRPKLLDRSTIEGLFGKGSVDFGFNQAFPRDNVLIIANDLIEFELKDRSRKVDIAGLYDILQERSRDSNICWYSTPHCPLRSTPENYPALSGRDFVLLNERILIGLSNEYDIATNSEGFRWMRNTFAFHDVMAVPLRNGIRSLSQAISVPRPDLAIVCTEGLEAIPSFMKGWDIIDITLEEALSFGADGLSVDENNYVIGIGEGSDHSRIIEELRSRGIDVHTVGFSAHMGLGGSVRSAVLPLRRDVPDS